MDNGPGTFSERSFGEILNETFVIYSSHFRKLIALAAVIHLPISLAALGVGESTVVFAVLAIFAVLATVLLYGATVVAVGQQYIQNEVTVVGCYQRAWWRVVTLGQFAVILGGGLVLTAALSLAALDLMERGVGLVSFLFLAMSFLIMGLLVYVSVAVQAIMLEGLKFTDGIRRSISLIRGSWQRVFGMSLVLGLIVIGLFMLIMIPFVVVASIFSGSETTGVAAAVFSFLGGLIVSVVTSPVGFVATTLIYFDLRVRSEGYDLETLSNELGLQTT